MHLFLCLGDSLVAGGHSGKMFLAFDKDQDPFHKHCGELYGNGWWFTDCFQVNLNGRYIDGGHATLNWGILWLAWKDFGNSLNRTEIKIRSISGNTCQQ